MTALRGLGFQGSDAEVIQSAAAQAPQLLSAFSSASSMWTANAATVSPSADSADGKLHFTVANLNNKLHRSQEAPTTAAILRATFADETCFSHHDALPQHEYLGTKARLTTTVFVATMIARACSFLFTASAPAAAWRR
jgi:succinylarginine dihydrolase